jgi:hypothetical protein
VALSDEAPQPALPRFLGPRLMLLSAPSVSEQGSRAIVDDEAAALLPAAARQISIGTPISIEPAGQLPDFQAQRNRAGLSVADMVMIARPPTEIRLDRTRYGGRQLRAALDPLRPRGMLAFVSRAEVRSALSDIYPAQADDNPISMQLGPANWCRRSLIKVRCRISPISYARLRRGSRQENLAKDECPKTPKSCRGNSGASDSVSSHLKP